MCKPHVCRAVIILPGKLVKNFIENITYSSATGNKITYDGVFLFRAFSRTQLGLKILINGHYECKSTIITTNIPL